MLVALITPGADDAEPGRRERKKLRTREALEAAALRLFAEKGYDHTTVEDIAEAADVAVRTFFRYFSSKQHILFGDVAHGIVDQLRAALAARPADEPPLAAVEAALTAMELDDANQRTQIRTRLQLVEQQPTLLGSYLMLFHQLRDVVVEFVADRTGRAPADMYPQLVASAAVGAMESSLCVWQGQRGQPDLTALGQQAYARLTADLTDPDA